MTVFPGINSLQCTILQSSKITSGRYLHVMDDSRPRLPLRTNLIRANYMPTRDPLQSTLGAFRKEKADVNAGLQNIFTQFDEGK